MQALEAFSLECSILPLRTKIREAQIEGGYLSITLGKLIQHCCLFTLQIFLIAAASGTQLEYENICLGVFLFLVC